MEYKQQKQKIDLKDVESWSEKVEIKDFVGKWFTDTLGLDKLKQDFKNAKPYPHVLIENFLDDGFAEELAKVFPQVDEKWHKYCNPIEVKFALDDLEKMPQKYKDAFYMLNTTKFIDTIGQVTGIENLEADPYLLGAGLHSHPRNGRLGIHLDFELHPISKKERRLNIILFLSKEWKEEWNGGLEIWEKNMSKKVHTFYPKFNSAVMFQTNDVSWHGLPDKILTPENISRQSLAIYYMSDPNTKKKAEHYRLKAKFVQRPDHPIDSLIPKVLYEIRANQRIPDDDLKKFYPEWTPEL